MDASSRSLPCVQRALNKYEYVTVDQPPYESSGRLSPSIPNATSWRTEMQWLMEENLEWIGMEDVAEVNPPPVHASDLSPQAPSLDDDEGEFDTDHDEANRGLP